MGTEVVIRRSGIPGPGSDVLEPLVAEAETAAATATAKAAEATATVGPFTAGNVTWQTGHSATLDRIKGVSLMGANPEKWYFVEFFFYKDLGTRASLIIAQADDAAGTGKVQVCAFELASGANYTGARTRWALTQRNTSGITGFAIIDFSDNPASFALYDGTYTTGGLPWNVIQSPLDTSAVNTLISSAISTNNIIQGHRVFLPQVSNTYMQDFITGIWLEGADPGHQYIVSVFETAYFSSIPLWRVRIRIKDLTTGYEVCEYSISSSTDPTGTGLLEPFGRLLYGSITTGYQGVQGLIGLNWSAVIWSTVAQNFTTAAESGIDKENNYSPDLLRSYLYETNPQVQLTVGSSGFSYTSMASAQASRYAYGLVPDNQSTVMPWSNQAGFNLQNLITVNTDNFSEDINEVLLPDFTIWEGKGIDNTVFYHTSPDTTERLLEFKHSGLLRKMTFIQNGPAYIVHADAFNDYSQPAASGQAIQRFHNFKVLDEVKLVTNATTGNAWGWGSGISSGEYQLFNNCIFSRPNNFLTAALIGVHTCPGSVEAATVHFRNCVADSFFNTEVVLLSGFDQKQINLCIVEGGDMKLISMASSFANTASDMPDKARFRVAWDTFGDAVGNLEDSLMEVLKIAPGTTVSGTKAGVTFGSGYDQKHGFGELLIMEENPYRKLGVRLGNCTTGGPHTLVLNGVTHTLLNNYTVMSEAAILAELNGTFGTNAITVTRLDRFIMLSSFGRIVAEANGALAAKRFVRFVSDKVVYCQDGEKPQGFTMYDMANGDEDFIITDTKFSSSLIPELGVNTDGEFGITNGVADYAASTKVGYVYNGLVTLYNNV